MESQNAPKRRRVKMSRPLRVRPSSPGDGHYEEVRTTVSASPDGLYFTTWRQDYYKGKRLFLTFPYSTTSGHGCPEYLGEVVHIDDLGTLRRGVGVRFLTSVTPL